VVDGVVDGAGDAMHAVFALKLHVIGGAILAGEETDVRVELPLFLLVRRPGDAEAGSGSVQGQRSILQIVAEAHGELEVRAQFPHVLNEEGVLYLSEAYGGSAGDVVEGGRRSA